MLDVLPHSAERELLRTEALIRNKDQAIAALILENTSMPEFESRRNALLALAYTGLGDPEEAHSRLERALASARTKSDTARAQHYQGLTYWSQGRLDEARSSARAAMEDPEWMAVAERLYGWTEVGSSRMSEAARWFGRSLWNTAKDDVHGSAHGLYALSAIATDMRVEAPLLEKMRQVRSEIAWAQGVAVEQFHVNRLFAWIDASDGDFSAMFADLRNAEVIAPTRPDTLHVLCDRAYLLGLFGSRAHALTVLDEAHDFALSINWHKTFNEERDALLSLAQLLSNTDGPAAAKVLAQYGQLTPTGGLAAYSRDIRTKAIETYVSACVASANGRASDAPRLFDESFRIYREIGFEWRALMVLMSQAETASAAGDFARYVLQRQPNAWLEKLCSGRLSLADLPHVAEPAASGATLSKRQIDVLRSLCRGAKSNIEIASELGMSATTVRDHIRDIRAKVGARNRSELIAYCVEKSIAS
jgi:DNA-binding CsgD family transcriptional regulator